MKPQPIVLDDKRIERLAQQIGDLMDEHNRLVKEGKIPAFKLMGLHNGYSAS